MNLWSKILAGGGCVVAGAVASTLLMRWRTTRTRQAQSIEAESTLEKARKEAEQIVNASRLSTNEEASKRRDELEKVHATKLAERTEAERRLSERETMLNSQLTRILETEIYVACRILNASVDVQIGKFGIREPSPRCPEVPLNQLDFVLVPGVAFDVYGRRLGRGKGYYDRLLAQVGGKTCGVAFDEQIVGEVPVGPLDIVLNCILTPERWVEPKQRPVL